VQKNIIIGVIAFFIGCIITSGIFIYFYTKTVSGYEARIKQSVVAYESIKRDLESANKTIADITGSNKESIGILKQLRESQYRLTGIFNKGIEKK